jgi:hypothetical protein
MIANNGAVKAFLSPSGTAGYRPSIVGSLALFYDDGIDHFRVFRDVPRMRRDPRVRLGLRIIAGPVRCAKWRIRGSSDVAAYVDETLRSVWLHWLPRILGPLLEYGWMGGEAAWQERQGRIVLREIRDFCPMDVRPLTVGRVLTGVRVYNVASHGEVTLRPPRALWVANESEYGHFYGRSRYEGAYVPFVERRGRHGATDARRLWFAKNAFRSGLIRYPAGPIPDEDGNLVDGQDLANEIVEKFATGGTLSLPNVRDERGDYAWLWDDAKVNGDIRGVREYAHDLDQEILEGMGVPPEVVAAMKSGSGYAGRSVPMVCFLTGEDEIVQTVIGALDRCVVAHGVRVNFGNVPYTIEPVSLVETLLGRPSAGRRVPPTKALPSPGGLPPSHQPYEGPRGGVGWRDPDTGSVHYEHPSWDGPDGGVLSLSHERAPKGGITVGGRFYRGGQFIPGRAMEEATPEERAAIEADKERHRQRLREMGEPDRGRLREALRPYEGVDLTAENTRSARRAYGALRSLHGDLTVHRISQLIDQDRQALEAEEPGSSMHEFYRRRLAAFRRMLDWHEAHEAASGGPAKAAPRPPSAEGGGPKGGGKGGGRHGVEADGPGGRSEPAKPAEPAEPEASRSPASRPSRSRPAEAPRETPQGGPAEDSAGQKATAATPDRKSANAVDVAYEQVRRFLNGISERIPPPAEIDAFVSDLKRNLFKEEFGKLLNRVGIAGRPRSLAAAAKALRDVLRNQADMQAKVNQIAAGARQKAEPEAADTKGPVSDAPTPPGGPARKAEAKSLAGGTALHPLAQKVADRFGEMLDGHQDLDPKKRASYREAMTGVLAAMPPEAVARIDAGVSGIHFYSDADRLGQALAAINPSIKEIVRSGQRVLGAFSITSRKLHLDGGGPKYSAREVYAHELGHALDGPRNEVSDSREWRLAWNAEIASGEVLGSYAAINVIEGMAEFARAVYGGKVDLSVLARSCPRCTAVWKSKGWWPESPQEPKLAKKRKSR